MLRILYILTAVVLALRTCNMLRARLVKIGSVLLLAYTVMSAPRPVSAESRPEIWFSPPDTVMQHSRDYDLLFRSPALWSSASTGIRAFSATANYLVRTSPETIAALTDFLRRRNIGLNVPIPAVPVDKNVCGDGIEGMVWPGEVTNYAKRLLERHIDVYSFSFDTPLESGHFAHKKNACRLSVAETAARLAISAKILRAAYPHAKFVDAEVPTGKASEEWLLALREWLDRFHAEAGEPLYALSLDIYWGSPWQDRIRPTVDLLHANGLRAAVFIHALPHPHQSASDWLNDARNNVCALRRLSGTIDGLIVANWSNGRIPNLPESDPKSLTAFLNWVEHTPVCP